MNFCQTLDFRSLVVGYSVVFFSCSVLFQRDDTVIDLIICRFLLFFYSHSLKYVTSRDRLAIYCHVAAMLVAYFVDVHHRT